MKTFLFWFRNARSIALGQSLLPTVVAFCLALKHGDLIWTNALAAFLGIISLHLCINLLDDYCDARKNDTSYRDRLHAQGMRARIGKCEYLKSGKANFKTLLTAALAFGAVAFICGFWLFLQGGAFIFVLALIAGFLGYSYSGAPLRLSYHGLGELTVALMFGPLLMSGMYFSATLSPVPPEVWIISIPMGLLAANILYIHAILDFEADQSIRKKTLAVVLNSKFKMNLALCGFIGLPYDCIIFGAIFGFLSPWYLITLITLPWAFYLLISVLKFQESPHKTVEKKWWMFPMGDWKVYQEFGIDWFMLRWISARNLVLWFGLICSIIALCL